MALPLADLLQAIKHRSGHDDLSQEWLDVALPELMAYLLAGPASCKSKDWLSWDDIPDTVQAILVGVFARHGSMGLGSIAEERIGDYSVRYSDPALFEGRIPRFFNDGEEVAIAKLAGCGGSLYSVSTGGIPLHDFSEPENSGALPSQRRSL
jgi:hypothetical protein